MPWKKIYMGALAYSLFEAVVLQQFGPLIYFSCGGITYLAVKDERRA